SRTRRRKRRPARAGELRSVCAWSGASSRNDLEGGREGAGGQERRRVGLGFGRRVAVLPVGEEPVADGAGRRASGRRRRRTGRELGGIGSTAGGRVEEEREVAGTGTEPR